MSNCGLEGFGYVLFRVKLFNFNEKIFQFGLVAWHRVQMKNNFISLADAQHGQQEDLIAESQLV